jgi:glutathione synthase
VSAPAIRIINVIIETLTGGRRCARSWPSATSRTSVNGDKRVLVIGGEASAVCLARIPKAGETRGNLAAGGTGVARELTTRDRLIAETLGPQLQAAGLLLVGLDVIGDPDRGQRHQPDLFPGNHHSDRLQRGSHVLE